MEVTLSLAGFGVLALIMIVLLKGYIDRVAANENRGRLFDLRRWARVWIDCTNTLAAEQTNCTSSGAYITSRNANNVALFFHGGGAYSDVSKDHKGRVVCYDRGQGVYELQVGVNYRRNPLPEDILLFKDVPLLCRGVPSCPDRVVFATAAVFKGSEIGGLMNADLLCTSEGNAGLCGPAFTYKALLSDGVTNAKDRVVMDGPVYNMNMAAGFEELAVDEADFWDGTGLTAHYPYSFAWMADGQSSPRRTAADSPLRLPPYNMSYDEANQTKNFAWTGTLPNGSKDGSLHCSNWLSDTGNGNAGSPHELDDIWADGGSWRSRPCDEPKKLYCYGRKN